MFGVSPKAWGKKAVSDVINKGEAGKWMPAGGGYLQALLASLLTHPNEGAAKDPPHKEVWGCHRLHWWNVLAGGCGGGALGCRGYWAGLMSSNFFHKLNEIFWREIIWLKFYLFQLLGYNSTRTQLMEEIEYFISPGLSVNLWPREILCLNHYAFLLDTLNIAKIIIPGLRKDFV